MALSAVMILFPIVSAVIIISTAVIVSHHMRS